MLLEEARLDCAATPTLNANAITAAVIQMCRMFMGCLFRAWATAPQMQTYASSNLERRTSNLEPRTSNLELLDQYIPSCSFAASDMRSRVHGGSHTIST